LISGESRRYLVPDLSQAIYNIIWEVLFIVYLENNEDKCNTKINLRMRGTTPDGVN